MTDTRRLAAIMAIDVVGYSRLMGDDEAKLRIAVGTLIAERPPHRSVRAVFPHTAPTLGA